MENLNLALVSSPKPLLLGHSSSKNVFTRRKPFAFGTFRVSANSSSSHVTRAASKSHQNLKSVQGKVTVHTFASISSSNSQETTSDGRTMVESKTADLRSQIRQKGDTNQASSIRNPWQQSDQTQSHSNHETQLKQSRDVALATAAKAKLLLRELKTVKADLAFAKARCAQLEEENKLLREREGSDKGLIRDDDDLRVATLLDWCWCWVFCTIFSGSFKIKEICNATSFKHHDGPDEYIK
ncbi:unnamed protein product [Vicia faba]|uniref:Uncharacterized protein n=1 Tax=Vicia faba TaxID=3906 RepID=A0AAV1B071_VICFA|nr:unnamed protein product [Vicia faba]